MAVEYEVVMTGRSGRELRRSFVAQSELGPGDVIRLNGRDWLVERVDDGEPPRVAAKHARYRLRLRHPDGREDVGAFRRYRPDSPRLGHSFTTIEDGRLVSWEVVDEQLANDDNGDRYLDLRAERDYAELEGDIPNHELEHAQAREAGEEGLAAASAMVARAQATGQSVELVALEPGEAPDWPGAEHYVSTLVLEEIEDDLLEMCGVDTDDDARDTWLDKVKERLREDLARFRADVEGDHDEIEEWDFRDGRIFAAVGSADDESNPDSGYGWMVRLVDASALGAAGFSRVRKAELVT